MYAPQLSNTAIETAQFTFIGFYIFFILYLLEIKTFDQNLSKALVGLAILCFTYALLNIILIFHQGLYSETRSMASLIVRLIVLPLNVALFIWIILKVKHPLMKYFVLGPSLFFIGAIVSSFIHYNNLLLVPDSMFNFTHTQHFMFVVRYL